MAVEKFTDAGIFFAGWNLTGQSNSVTLERSAEILDASVFGVGTRVNAAGLWVWNASVAGFWDTDDATYVTTSLFEKLGTLTDSLPLILYPKNADGGLAYAFMATQESLELLGALGELTPFSTEFRFAREQAAQNYHHPVQGWLAMQHASRTADGNGTEVDVGTLSSAQVMVCASMVTALNGTSVDIIFETDDNSGFTSATTRSTHSYTGANEADMTSVSGPITPDNYWRVRWDLTGTSFSGVAVFGVA